jgi:hypothetical protein
MIQDFVRTPTAADWTRFASYARRVRKLRCEEDDLDVIHPSVFDTLARTRTSYRIFPNLKTLYWLAQSRAFQPSVTVFMHEGIKEYWSLLDIYVNDEELRRSTADVTERMQKLI